MTSKEKAIEVLKDIRNEYIKMLVIITEKPLTVICNDYDDENSFKTLDDFITQPTIDDAIKVVEEMKNNPNNNFMTMKQVLTALKGLKEGK